jgi:hypothetical protein
MRLRFLVLLLSIALLQPALAGAQSIEVGVTTGSACRGSEVSICGGGYSSLLGGYLSLITVDRIEIGMRIARMGVDPSGTTSFARDNDPRFLAVPDPPEKVDFAFRDRSRTFLLGHFLYHFLSGERVRPLLGFGIGSLVNTGTIACQPAGCEKLLPTLARLNVGHNKSTGLDLAFLAGASVRATDRMRIRAGVQLHNFPGEELSTTAVYLEVGYRFGSRRHASP